MSHIKYACYEQISPERDVSGDAFSKGQINFKWNMDSMTKWNPYKSFLRMRVSLKNAAEQSLKLIDGIGPNMFMGDCFWQQSNIQCNGVKVSEMDDYVPQISALKQRYAIPESRRTELLHDTNFAQSSVYERINQVSSDGAENSIHSTFKPGDQSSTISSVGPLDSSLAANISILGVTANNTGGVTQANISRATASVAYFNTYGVGSKIQIADVIYTVVAVDSPTQAFVTPFPAGNIGATAVQGVVRTAVEQTQIDGVNTTFTTDIQEGDELVIDGIPGYIVDSVVSDTQLFVTNPVPFINTTANWYVKRKHPSRQLQEFELIYKPCLGLFGCDEFLEGNWKLELTPYTENKWQRYVIESLVDKIPGTDYSIEVVDLQLYIWRGRSTKAHSGPRHIQFNEIRCQTQAITTNTLINKTFVVNKNSHTFTITFQKPDAGDVTNFSKTKFRMLNDYEKNIARYQLRLNGESLPTPTPSIDTQAALGRDFATQQYYEQLQYNGTIYLDDPESLTTWFERGPYYSYKMPRKLQDKGNRLYISVEFNGQRPENFLLLVFDHYYSGFKMEVQNGLVSKVERNRMVN